ncbi:MAG: UpxY family transcription antiterminator [Kiritimatiellae bacterium]|nr:UpxY family transcription antiterminator [Kiritimatiellia bacterium]
MKRDWFVLHVKPRTEKKVARYLQEYGYFYHLPIWVKVTKVQRRRVKRYLPLFPGYVFTKLYPEERVAILRSNLIVKTIFVEQPRLMIHQLRQVAHASRGDTSMMPVSMCKVGDYVRVVSGPMRGMEGYIQRKGREASLCLNVEILGAAVEVSVAPFDIEIINR